MAIFAFFVIGMDEKSKQRITLSIYFFLSGFCFATWASRIPTIKTVFNLNEAELGSLLLAMPISSLVGLPISGWLVSRFDSRIPLMASFFFFSLGLTAIGLAKTPFMLVAAICLFSFSMRILNIAINTQAITLQKLFNRKINGSFHGIWSTGGIAGVGFSSLMVKLQVSMAVHLLAVSLIVLLVAIMAFKLLLRNDRSPHGNKLIIGKPDPFILNLGILIFLAALCEGGMYDWSGVYFKEVIQVEVFTLGYLVFMIFMALSRFLSDYIIDRLGVEKTYLLSALLISSGVFIIIVFPFFWPAMIGFCIVGFGAASIFPMTMTLAGTSKKYSAGMVISIIGTYGILGMFIGPPLIGYLAHAFDLRISFILFIIAGLMLIPFSQLLFRHQKNQE
ncbi:MFS transporter [Flavobacteriaceae bacterium KMM 6898]|nr:MFS transporter [Flavobacteriaceae bacterium KMM 6898]